MLAAMFISAVFEFGKIDLIGHTLIVVALFGILADDGGKPARLRDSWLLPVTYAAALALFLAVYYVGHADCSAPRSSDRHARSTILLHVHHEPHLRMDGA